MRALLRKIMPLLWLLVAIQGSTQWMKPNVIPTAVWWVVDILMLVVFADDYLRDRRQDLFWVRVFLLWTLVGAVRGLFLSEGYWDYKALCENLFVFLTPLCVVRYGRPDNLRPDVWLLMLFIVPIYVILHWNLQAEGVGRFFFIVTFFLLFLPRINPVHRLYVYLILALVLIFGSLESRTMMVRLGFAILLSLSLLNKNLLQYRFWFHLFATVFFIAPIVLIILAYAGVFNIFDAISSKEGKYVIVVDDSENDDPKGVSDLMDDTRSFIYVESITSAVRNDYYVIGHSLSRGYQSETFGWDTDNTSGYRGERNNGEVGILNVFTHLGLVGVLIYFFLFISASHAAIKKGKSPQMLVLGLWIAFRWFLAWVEEFTTFDVNTLLLWVEIGMCLSPAFRSMDRAAFSRFVNDCFPLNRVSLSDIRAGRYRSLF